VDYDRWRRDPTGSRSADCHNAKPLRDTEGEPFSQTKLVAALASAYHVAIDLRPDCRRSGR
jgi:hypothetical protein